MKVALLSDSHFGARNDNLMFYEYFVNFYDKVFFPEIERRKISTIIHLGDLFERRKFINVNILHRTRIDVFQRIVDGGYDTHIILGNHDTSFRDTNSVNSVTEMCQAYKFHIYEEPTEVLFDKLHVLLMPWLNPTNMQNGLDMIARSHSPVLMGHLEIAGFFMDQIQKCKHGLDREVLAKFKAVFSGHFHHASQDGNIRYLGAQYQMTFGDLNDPKGFYIFDTDTLVLEFIHNPFSMFFRLVYDDRDESKHEEMLRLDVDQFKDKYVRVVMPYKTNPVLADKYIDRLLQANPADLQIKDQYSLEVSEEADEQFTDFESTGEVVLTDTMTILSNYVDAIGMEIDKERLTTLMRELYVEAISIGAE